ncbi:MAG: GAF domain-containing protein [Nannocystaceae bacterium]
MRYALDGNQRMRTISDDLEQWLTSFISEEGAVAGTVHLRNEENLQLKAAVCIPPPVKAQIASIPRGKGMAGLAWERDKPVSTCNLATDTSGDVRPGAKAVEAQAAVALPVHDDVGTVRGVVGIAFAKERQLSDADLSRLQARAESLPSHARSLPN